MAPVSDAFALLKRQIYYGGNNCYPYGCNSTWYRWGRWLLLGIVVLFAFVFFYLFVCTRNRRLSKQRKQPIYGTAWMGQGGGYYPPPPGPPPQQAQHTGTTPYYGQYNGQGNASVPPPYSPSPGPYGGAQNQQQTGTYYYGQNGQVGGSNMNEESYEMQYRPPTSPPAAAKR
ncbi:chitin synthesis regulation, resistance to congo red-domain-containing protein [Dipodascopsis uninucleata]